MAGPLNLSDFTEPTGFDPVPPGKYFARVFDAEDRETQGGGKTPAGTPMIWVHFQITGKVGDDEQGEDSPYFNKRAFRNLVIPPADYGDEAKRKAMNGMVVSLFRACGWTMEEITSGEFNIEAQDLIERELVIQVNRKERRDSDNNKTGEYENQPIGFFSVESMAEEGAAPSPVI